MKPYLFLLFFGISAYGADNIENSEITDDFSVYNARLEPVGFSISDGITQLPLSADIEAKYLHDRLIVLFNASRTRICSFKYASPHEKMITQSMGKSAKSYKKLLALDKHAKHHDWPVVEQTVITQLAAEHPYATIRRPAHSKKRIRLMFWHKTK